MALHLIKLCVGVESVEELEKWVKARKRHAHVTRQTPKRADEVLEGGSLYWVIRGAVQCRQPILGLEPCVRDGVPSCRIVLDQKIVRTEPLLRRAFQGWRYLEEKDAPADLKKGRKSAEGLPPDLQRRLIEIGAW